MGPAERSGSDICQLVRGVGGGEWGVGGEFEKSTEPIVRKCPTVRVGRGAAFRHQALSASSTISFHSFKYHLFSLICFVSLLILFSTSSLSVFSPVMFFISFLFFPTLSSIFSVFCNFSLFYF